MADMEDVQVMVLDFDTEGVDDERIREFEGNPAFGSAQQKAPAAIAGQTITFPAKFGLSLVGICAPRSLDRDFRENCNLTVTYS